MNLILNQYLEADAADVAERLDAAVVHGIDAAATRIAAPRADVTTEHIDDGLRVSGGVDVLDGSELHVEGVDGLTIIEFRVPWQPGRSVESKLLAANAFAHTVAKEIDAAA